MDLTGQSPHSHKTIENTEHVPEGKYPYTLVGIILVFLLVTLNKYLFGGIYCRCLYFIQHI